MAIEGNTKFSDYPPQRTLTLTELQQDSNDIFVPVVTDDENYKLNVNELNSQKLVDGNNISISNDNVISAKDSFLEGDGNTIFVDNVAHKIRYTGPEGESTHLVPSGGFSITQSTKKINYNLRYGTEVGDIHPGTMYNSCTSTYFIKDTVGGNRLVPQFAGYSNQLLPFAFNSPAEVGPWKDENLYDKSGNYAHSVFRQVNLDSTLCDAILAGIDQLNPPLKDYPKIASGHQFSLVFADYAVIQFKDSSIEKTYYLNNNNVFTENSSEAKTIAGQASGYSQFVFNIPDLHTIYLHTKFLEINSNKEILLIQVNPLSSNFYTYNDRTVQTWWGRRLRTVQIWNSNPVGHTSNFYFYHNGQIYTKLNDAGTATATGENGHAIIICGLSNQIGEITDVPSDTYCYTQLQNSNEIGANGVYIQGAKSGPFCFHMTTNDQDSWCMNMVNRFVCIVNKVSATQTDYYIIETMY